MLSVPTFVLAAIAAPAGWSATAAAQPVSPVRTIGSVGTARVMLKAAPDSDRFSDHDSDHDQDRATDRDHWKPRRIAWHMLHAFRWSPRHQFKYLNWLWERESSWNVYATNPYSGAYGIPQAVPGGKMASAGRNWRTSARTQILWGLRYIRSTYGSPARAWWHETSYGWY